jgi:hypothetical protein
VGLKSRRKGARNELALAHALGGKRVPLSGAAGGEFAGDVLWRGLRIEAKVRADGFRQLYGWLVGNDALAVRADGQGWLMVVPLERFLELVEGRE